jgi:hypothetical protein
MLGGREHLKEIVPRLEKQYRVRKQYQVHA